MYYLIDNDENLRYDDIEDVLDYCVTSEYYENDTEGFEEYLNEEGTVEVAGYEFEPSEILRELNYDGYQRELQYWAENQIEFGKENFEYDLRHTDPGEFAYIANYKVYVYADSEDEEEDEEDNPDMTALKEKLLQNKQEEEEIYHQEEKTGNDFMSLLQII